MLVTHDPEIAAITPRCIEIKDGKIRRDLRNTPLPSQAALATPS